MSDWIKCDKCNKITQADSSGDKRYKIGVDGFDGYSVFHLCEWCLRSFYLDFLGWKWKDDECQYVPQESRDKGITKEIALHCMKSASESERELCEECPIYGQTGCDHCYEDALQYVIGMLEQEPILDKIRAEIERVFCISVVTNELRTPMEVKTEILQIIDKYKAGSKEQESEE